MLVYLRDASIWVTVAAVVAVVVVMLLLLFVVCLMSQQHASRSQGCNNLSNSGSGSSSLW